mmetsp:Transcript_77155/g.136676  ORF Transcript_77155/g.136676 Transcript_77155/m.136676 type:complete len:441 (-) Transcript_77155:110-1432(-)
MTVATSPHAAEARHYRKQIFQIWLMAGCRLVINMGRICLGPMVVAMAPEFEYISVHKGQILGAFSAGYMLPQIAGGILADHIGAKYILLFSLTSMGLSLCILPMAADVGVASLWWVLAITGFMCGPVFPAKQAMTAKWTYGGLSSYAQAVAGAGTTAGSLLALGLTSPLCVRIGWRMTSVAFGYSSLLFSFVWFLSARSSPADARPLIQHHSPPPILRSTTSTWRGAAARWTTLLLAPPVLVIFLVHSAQVAVRTFLAQWMPTYYMEELHATSEIAALCLVLPEILGMFSSLLGGNIARSLEQYGVSTLACRRIFLTAGSMGIGLGLLSITKLHSPVYATCALCITNVFSNLHQIGFTSNYLDVAKSSSGLVSGVGNSLASFASYLGALITSSVLTGQADRQWGWANACLIFAVATLLSLALYLPFASATPIGSNHLNSA